MKAAIARIQNGYRRLVEVGLLLTPNYFIVIEVVFCLPAEGQQAVLIDLAHAPWSDPKMF